jgi:hypothetical protein
VDASQDNTADLISWRSPMLTILEVKKKILKEKKKALQYSVYTLSLATGDVADLHG